MAVCSCGMSSLNKPQVEGHATWCSGIQFLTGLNRKQLETKIRNGEPILLKAMKR